MTKQIWKYSLADAEIRVPRDAEILSLQVQDGKPMLWVLVIPEAPLERWAVAAIMTGQPFEPVGEYVGSALLMDGLLVVHFWIDRG